MNRRSGLLLPALGLFLALAGPARGQVQAVEPAELARGEGYLGRLVAVEDRVQGLPQSKKNSRRAMPPPPRHSRAAPWRSRADQSQAGRTPSSEKKVVKTFLS